MGCGKIVDQLSFGASDQHGCYRHSKSVRWWTSSTGSLVPFTAFGGCSTAKPKPLARNAEVEAWRKANHIKQTDLAASLGMSPQQLNKIIQDREDPTGKQTLHMQELIRTKPVEEPKEK